MVGEHKEQSFARDYRSEVRGRSERPGGPEPHEERKNCKERLCLRGHGSRCLGLILIRSEQIIEKHHCAKRETYVESRLLGLVHVVNRPGYGGGRVGQGAVTQCK